MEFEFLISFDSPTQLRYAQGMEILDGRVFQAFSDGTIDVFELGTGQLMQILGPLFNEDGECLHMNDLTFKRSNEGILLIVSGNKINSNIHCFQVIEEMGEYEIIERELIPPPIINDVVNLEASQYFGSSNVCVQIGYRRSDDNGYGDSFIEAY